VALRATERAVISYEARRVLASLSKITIFLPRSVVAFAVGLEAFNVSAIVTIARTEVMKIGMSVGQRLRSHRGTFRSGVIFAIALLSSVDAHAVSERVKSACRNDYFAHCSQYAVDTEELRQCMRKVGEDLSTPCLVALVEDGQITKEDVARHNAAKEAATKTKSEVASDDPGDPKTAGVKSTKKKSAAKKHAKKGTDVAEATGEETKASGETKKTAKGKKAHKAGTKAKSAEASAETTPSTKKKGKKAKAASTANGAATPAGTAKPAGKKSTHKKSAATSATTKAKTGTKKKSPGTAVKAKKTSKKKSAAKHSAKPVDATAP
jgi:hypothetical protein